MFLSKKSRQPYYPQFSIGLLALSIIFKTRVGNGMIGTLLSGESLLCSLARNKDVLLRKLFFGMNVLSAKKGFKNLLQ